MAPRGPAHLALLRVTEADRGATVRANTIECAWACRQPGARHPDRAQIREWWEEGRRCGKSCELLESSWA